MPPNNTGFDAPVAHNPPRDLDRGGSGPRVAVCTARAKRLQHAPLPWRARGPGGVKGAREHAPVVPIEVVRLSLHVVREEVGSLRVLEGGKQAPGVGEERRRNET
jgi:hypothetical protein